MVAPARYLIIPMASPGYLFPAIRLALILQQRGHQVLFAATADFQLTLQQYGMPAVPVRNDGSPFLHPASWFQSESAPAEVSVLRQIAEAFRPDFIVSNPLTLASFILAEERGIPHINIGFSEYLYPGIQETGEAKLWRLKSITDYYNAYRAAVGLPPIACSPEDSPLIGSVYLLRSIPELHDEMKLPPQVRFIGSFYWEPAFRSIGLDHFLERNRSVGRPNVYVQIGRLFEDAPLWEKLIAALAPLPAGFVMDTGRADYLYGSMPLPANCFAAPFIPLGAISSEIGAVISSGQTTSMISAVIHGKPILCIPHSADARELCKKFVARKLAAGIFDSSEIQPQNIQSCLQKWATEKPDLNTAEYKERFLSYTDDFVYSILPGS